MGQSSRLPMFCSNTEPEYGSNKRQREVRMLQSILQSEHLPIKVITYNIP